MITTKLIRSTRRRVVKNVFYHNQTKNISLWTQDNIVKSPFKDIVVPKTLVVNKIWENLDKWSNRTAIVCGVTKKSYTYHQLYKYARNFAARLRKDFKIVDGDVICLMMPNNPDYVVAILGALEAGAAVTTLNPMYTAYEVHRHIVLSKPKVVIGTSETLIVVTNGLKEAKSNAHVIAIKTSENEIIPSRYVQFDQLASNAADVSVLSQVNRNANDVAFLPYSSGTTGLPKGVELTNGNVVANILQTTSAEVKHFNETTASNQDAVLAVLPFFHIYGFSIILAQKLCFGLKVVSLPKFYPNTFISAMDEHKIDLLYTAPPLVLFLSSHADVKKSTLESVHTCVSAAASLPKADGDKLREKLRPDTNFFQMYGLTETSPIATSSVQGELDFTHVGVPVPSTELKVIDPQSRSLGPNEIGELLIRGPQVMKGYRNNPEATKNSITEDGWFKSGDMALIDKNGKVSIVDRIKELIKVKGFQVAPAELEGLLKEHRSVLDAGVVGAPDARTGEVPKAFVVLKEGEDVKPDDLIQFVNSKVTEFKKIKEITVLTSLPKNPSGKLLRRVLKEKYVKN